MAAAFLRLAGRLSIHKAVLRTGDLLSHIISMKLDDVERTYLDVRSIPYPTQQSRQLRLKDRNNTHNNGQFRAIRRFRHCSLDLTRPLRTMQTAFDIS